MPCDRFEKAQRNLPEIHVRASVDPIGCLKPEGFHGETLPV